MAIIIGVRFRDAGRVYYFDPGDHQVKKGDRVIVETARGVECGEVAQENSDVPEDQVKRPLKLMIRAATAADLANVEGKAAREAEAFKICEEKILKHALDMKLVNVEYTFDASKIIFHFTADQRVDFRALVRDLAGVFRTRIELRQIGVRDEAKLLGGLGVCGRPFCCSLFMGDFHPVSIKMAKEQGLSLNPTKISGTCGRLMCCLKYEEAAYEDALKTLPKIGSGIDTPEGRGVVTEVNAVSQNIKVRLDRRPEAAPMAFQYSAIEGAQRRPAAVREDAMPGLFPMEPPPAEEPAAPPAPEPERGPAAQPRERERRENFRQKQRGQNQRQHSQQHQPQQKQKPVNPPAEAPKKQPAPPAEKQKPIPSNAEGGKNWRERHPQRKPEQPAYREEPRKAHNPLPRLQQQHDAKNIPRYGEVVSPRRANAPKPAQPQSSGNQGSGEKVGGANYRKQPWQKKKDGGNKG